MGNATPNGCDNDRIMGCVMAFGSVCEDYVVEWFQNGLFEMSFARSVMISMRIYHSTGLKETPNANLR